MPFQTLKGRSGVGGWRNRGCGGDEDPPKPLPWAGEDSSIAAAAGPGTGWKCNPGHGGTKSPPHPIAP